LCDEILTPSSSSTAAAVDQLETKDEPKPQNTATTIQPPPSSPLQIETSIVSSTTSHSTTTTRLHRIPDSATVQSDEALIDITTVTDNLCLTKNYEPNDASDDNYALRTLNGDIVVTIILQQSDNATEIITFIVNHINGIDLLVHNITIGEFLIGLRNHSLQIQFVACH